MASENSFFIQLWKKNIISEFLLLGYVINIKTLSFFKILLQNYIIHLKI